MISPKISSKLTISPKISSKVTIFWVFSVKKPKVDIFLGIPANVAIALLCIFGVFGVLSASLDWDAGVFVSVSACLARLGGVRLDDILMTSFVPETSCSNP